MPKEPVQNEKMPEIEFSEAYTDAGEQESIIKERERRVAEARSLNLLSNTFMTVVLEDKLACQHVLRVVTGVSDLEVKEVRKQYRVAKITSHDAILDILAEDGKKQLYNLEIQRSETIDHARRTRFYGAMIDSEYLAKGKDYDEMPEVDAGTAVAEMMKYFKTADPQDMSQGELSNRVHFLKCEEGGYEVMCEMSEKWVAEGRIKGKAEGIREGEEKKAKEVVFSLAARGMTPENIADIVKMNIAVVKKWLEGATVVR